MNKLNITDRVTCGGSWCDPHWECRLSYQEFFPVDAQYTYIGFRLVRKG